MADKFKACSIEGCNGNSHRSAHGSGGLCCAHYQRRKRLGDALAGGTMHGDLMRFAVEEALPYGGKDCLIWPFSRDGKGYGRLKIDGVSVAAHRYICKMAHGTPPTPEHEAAHSCGKGHLGCVNPNHLSWKTRPGNFADKLTHGTHNRGERHPLAKITEEVAREIISLKGKETQASVANRFGLAQTTVSQIQRGARWGWVNLVMD